MVSAEFTERIKAALQELRAGSANLASFFQEMALFHQRSATNPQINSQAAAQLILDDALAHLNSYNAKLADIIRAFYWERERSNTVCTQFSISSATLSRRQKEGQRELAKLIWESEQTAVAEIREERLQDFPIPDYKRTFGLKTILDELAAALSPELNNRILLLVGLGGIGKTTVALELVRRIALSSQFEQFFLVKLPDDPYLNERPNEEYWELAINHLISRFDPKSNLLPLEQRERVLRSALTKARCLIVIDNIEATDVATLILENLRRVAGRSHFIVTSRNRPLSQIIVHTTEIQELALADARELLAFQLRDQQVIREEKVPDEILDAILPITRGHPQAILLVVNMLKTMSLADVTATLAEGRSQPIAELYEDIYAHTWALLSENAKLLLMTIFTAAPAGGTAHHLMDISRLSNFDFFSTIQELTRASIIEVRGDFNERVYGLHQLTLNFLRTKFGRDS